MANFSTCNHSKLFIDIEDFVEKTIYHSGNIGWEGFKQELEFLINEIDFEYDDNLWYSAYIQAILQLKKQNTINGKVDYEQLYQMKFEDVQAFFTTFVRQREVERKNFYQAEERNREQLLKHIDNLTQHYSKLLFVRVDLAYIKEKHADIDIRLFRDDVQKLIGYIQDGDRCFSDLEGYAWALEQGEEKGYHCHLLLIYNGAVKKQDYYYANEVIERWKQITKQDGYGFNCNSTEHKEQFRKSGKLGIGMIYRNDLRSVENAKHVCSYLVNPEKDKQYLRVKPLRMRTFGMSKYRRSDRRYRERTSFRNNFEYISSR